MAASSSAASSSAVSSSATSSSAAARTELLARANRAESLHKQLTKLKPSLGEYRTMVDEAAEESEFRETIRQNKLKKLDALILENESSLSSSINALAGALDAQSEIKKQKAEEPQRQTDIFKRQHENGLVTVETRVAHFKSQKRQEAANMKFIRRKLVESVTDIEPDFLLCLQKRLIK